MLSGCDRRYCGVHFLCSAAEEKYGHPQKKFTEALNRCEWLHDNVSRRGGAFFTGQISKAVRCQALTCTIC